MFGNSIIGTAAPSLATGLANGLVNSVQTGIQVNSIDTGTVGIGTGNGFGILISPSVLFNAISLMFTAHGILGISATPLVNAISIGLSQSMLTASIQTNNPTVGIGTGVVTLLPNLVSIHEAFRLGLSSVNINGVKSESLISAVSEGLSMALLSATGVILIVGTPSTIPSAGVGLGKLS